MDVAAQAQELAKQEKVRAKLKARLVKKRQEQLNQNGGNEKQRAAGTTEAAGG